MTNPAAISGTFADFKLVKTRSAAQVIIEVPIEQADKALSMLGGLPVPGHEKPVAVARLNTALKESETKERRRFDELSRAQQAGILCNEGGFQTFLEEEKGLGFTDTPERDVQAATAVRRLCNVNSRAQFDTNPEVGSRWDRLHEEYRVWQQT